MISLAFCKQLKSEPWPIQDKFITFSAQDYSTHSLVRYAIVRGAESGRAATESDVEVYVQSRAHGMPATDVGVTTIWKPDNKPGSVVEVKVDIPFRTILPMLSDMTLTSTAQMVISF
jgi:hypothetical protein